MRAIGKPTQNPIHVFNTCVGSIADHNQRLRLAAISAHLLAEGDEYDQKATRAELYSIPVESRRNEEIVRGAVTKAELRNLYTSHMVGKSKLARNIYQSLLDAAPLGFCPSCGYGHAETLDHYLSKAGFPQFSIFPLNLVPACKSCNHVKLAAVASTPGQQPLHPYYDHGLYISEQWLYAEVRESAPPAIRYYALAPGHWDDVSKERVAFHFSGFQLSRRFGLQAASEVASLRSMFSKFCPTIESRRARLLEHAATQCALHVNCWKTALYQALASSEWYCREGYAVG